MAEAHRRDEAPARTLAGARSSIFARMWENYRIKVPQVPLVEDALRGKGEVWSEDHVALRTLPGAHCGAHVLQGIFEALGYVRRDSLHFADKKLDAFWLQPPMEPGAPSAGVSPKVFVSELLPSHFPHAFQAVVAKYTARVEASPLPTVREAAARVLAAEATGGDAVAWSTLVDTVVGYLTSGPAWGAPRLSEYEVLRAESEYAAWTLIFGPQANHFTVSVHLMSGFGSLTEFNDHLMGTLGVPMNASGGGLVKGSPAFRLEQSATLASPVPAAFQEGTRQLPYAFVEFAWRFPMEGKARDGLWESYYQGFVVSNADRIFESTNVPVDG